MKRGARLQRRKPLKQRRRPKRTEAELEAAALWRQNLGPCAMRREDLGCYGRIEGHHLVPREALRKRGLYEHMWRLENRLPLCQYHHERHTKALHRVPRSLIPLEAWEFAAELDLEWLLLRAYPE